MGLLIIYEEGNYTPKTILKSEIILGESNFNQETYGNEIFSIVGNTGGGKFKKKNGKENIEFIDKRNEIIEGIGISIDQTPEICQKIALNARKNNLKLINNLELAPLINQIINCSPENRTQIMTYLLDGYTYGEGKSYNGDTPVNFTARINGYDLNYKTLGNAINAIHTIYENPTGNIDEAKVNSYKHTCLISLFNFLNNNNQRQSEEISTILLKRNICNNGIFPNLSELFANNIGQGVAKINYLVKMGVIKLDQANHFLWGLFQGNYKYSVELAQVILDFIYSVDINISKKTAQFLSTGCQIIDPPSRDKLIDVLKYDHGSLDLLKMIFELEIKNEDIVLKDTILNFNIHLDNPNKPVLSKLNSLNDFILYLKKLNGPKNVKRSIFISPIFNNRIVTYFRTLLMEITDEDLKGFKTGIHLLIGELNKSFFPKENTEELQILVNTILNNRELGAIFENDASELLYKKKSKIAFYDSESNVINFQSYDDVIRSIEEKKIIVFLGEHFELTSCEMIGEGGYGKVYLLKGENNITRKMFTFVLKFFNPGKLISVNKSINTFLILKSLNLPTFNTLREFESNNMVTLMTPLSTDLQLCFSANNKSKDKNTIESLKKKGTFTIKNREDLNNQIEKIFEKINSNHIQINYDAFLITLKIETDGKFNANIILGDFDNITTESMFVEKSNDNIDEVKNIIKNINEENETQKKLLLRKLDGIIGR